MCFLQADYKSAELFVMAYMSGDKRLQEDLKGDMHSANAKRFGVPRATAKNVTYACQYLAGPPKVSEMILEQEHEFVDIATCKRIMDGLASYYTDVTAYKRHLISLCDTKKYIKNPFGRIRFFHDGGAPAAVDYIPQSVVADILWCVLKEVAMFARTLGGRLTTTVHDSILIQVPKDKVAVAAAGMKKIMERTFDCVAQGFFIPVEVEVGAPGASWGNLHAYTV
jgi:DNA polymerase I-like protein with 3'-5' exonuclease and polymerase domains